jgi:hypothetical protein
MYIYNAPIKYQSSLGTELFVEEASILQSSFWQNYRAVNNAVFNDTTPLNLLSFVLCRCFEDYILYDFLGVVSFISSV